MTQPTQREAFEKWFNGAYEFSAPNDSSELLYKRIALDGWQAFSTAMIEALQSPEMVEVVAEAIQMITAPHDWFAHDEFKDDAKSLIQAIVERVR